MKDLLELARQPAVVTSPDATVHELSKLLKRERAGAAVVLDYRALVGIISERDVVERVVAAGRDPTTTRVSEIMTTDVRTAPAGMKIPEALAVMYAGRFHHLPLVGTDGGVVGILSIRHLLRSRVADLDVMNADLITYSAADGPGG
jgi:CBS domain-containing protein